MMIEAQHRPNRTDFYLAEAVRSATRAAKLASAPPAGERAKKIKSAARKTIQEVEDARRRSYQAWKQASELEVSVPVPTLRVDPRSSIDRSDRRGILYAWSFPSLKNPTAYPVKVGRTSQRDAAERVLSDKSSLFEKPDIIQLDGFLDTHAAERRVFEILDGRGLRKDTAAGREWFMTTIEDAMSVIRDVRQEQFNELENAK